MTYKALQRCLPIINSPKNTKFVYIAEHIRINIRYKIVNKPMNAKKIISKYQKLIESIDQMISNTPVKKEYLADKLGVSRTTFYNKRRNRSFTLKEIEVLLMEMDKFQ